MEPQNIKNRKSLQEFKRLIKIWKPEACLAEHAKQRCKYWVHFIKHTPFLEPKQKDKTFILMDHVNHHS